MKSKILAILLVLGVPLHAEPFIDLNDISCIEAATSGPRGEYTGEQIHLILLSIENYWRQEFARRGLIFRDVGYRVYSGRTQTLGCGPANSDMGPFYCMADGFVYVDPGFFYTRGSISRLGRPTQAMLTFVLAHEFGHHIQNLLEVMPRVESVARMRFGGGFMVPQIDFGPEMEYQADCLAGVYLNQIYVRNLLTLDEVYENVGRMSKLGDDFQDDMLARQFGWPILISNVSSGYSHGTSAKRKEWMVRGVKTGDMKQCETFSFPTLN